MNMSNIIPKAEDVKKNREEKKIKKEKEDELKECIRVIKGQASAGFLKTRCYIRYDDVIETIRELGFECKKVIYDRVSVNWNKVDPNLKFSSGYTAYSALFETAEARFVNNLISCKNRILDGKDKCSYDKRFTHPERFASYLKDAGYTINVIDDEECFVSFTL